MEHNVTLESIAVGRFQSMQFIMYINPPFTIRTDSYLILPQRRAIAAFHITIYRFLRRALLTISMSTQT